MDLDRNGLELLDEQECLRLLATASVGRVGLSVSALPVVLPVNFALIERDILIRTHDGAKLDAAWNGSIVAFEADDFDAVSCSGWSVLVQGPSRVIVPTEPASRSAEETLARWPGHDSGDFVAISCDIVTGRRLHPPFALPGAHRYLGSRA